jgi:hypothetical protein
MQVTWGVKQGTGAGTIVIFNGASGTTAGAQNYIAPYISAGFSTVQIAWATAWQDTGLNTKSILTAACRVATIGQYIHDNVYTTGGFAVQGGSGGAGAGGYWLAWYGGGNVIDNAELASGPVYSDIEQGCEVPLAPPVTIIPTDGTPWLDVMSYRGGPQNGVSTQTGYTCQPSKGSTSEAADASWLSQSIVQTGATLSYPNTNVSGWLCNNGLNNSSGEAWLFYSQMTSPYSLTSLTGCTSAESVDEGLTPEGLTGTTAIINDMVTKGVKRHPN